MPLFKYGSPWKGLIRIEGGINNEKKKTNTSTIENLEGKKQKRTHY